MRPFIASVFILSLILGDQPRFSDAHLLTMTPHYFSSDHQAPKVLGTNIYNDRSGRNFRVDIQVDRNRPADDFAFAFYALSQLSLYAKSPFQQFIVVMHYDIRGKLPDIYIGKVRCTVDAFIKQKIDYNAWLNTCVHRQEL